TFDSQGNYNFTGQQVLKVGPLSLDKATFTISNTVGGLTFSDAWNLGVYSSTVSGSFVAEGKGFVITADAKGTFLGQSLELKGDIHSSGVYDLTGHAKVGVGPLTLSDAAFELSNTKGFSFSDSWNYSIFTGSVSVVVGSTSQG